MNPEIKEKWVAALRSGKYMQGAHCLRIGDNFCCLAVLCDILREQVSCEWKLINGSRGYRFDEENALLSINVMEISGLETDVGGYVQINGKSDSLVIHNDDGRTFEEIADAIEEQL